MMNKIIKTVAFLGMAVCTLAAACTSQPKPEPVTMPADSASIHLNERRNGHIVDSAVSLLKSGNVVVRTGLGADSYILSQMNLKDKTYSHCGIVMVEHGYPFVYHCIGGEDNPDARMRRDSAKLFFSPDRNFGIGIIAYDIPGDKEDSLRHMVHHLYSRRPKFDMSFDLATDDRLYCAEFIYKAYNMATGDTAYINTSYAQGYRFVGIDDLYINRHAHFVWQVRYK